MDPSTPLTITQYQPAYIPKPEATGEHRRALLALCGTMGIIDGINGNGRFDTADEAMAHATKQINGEILDDGHNYGILPSVIKVEIKIL